MTVFVLFGFFFVSVSYLDELSLAGECAAEYLGLYQKLIKPTHWKVYLAARGVLPYIGNLITKVKLDLEMFSQINPRAVHLFELNQVIQNWLQPLLASPL